MIIKSASFKNFKCFEEISFDSFDPHFNLIIGENGSGKSSALEALSNSTCAGFLNEGYTNKVRETIFNKSNKSIVEMYPIELDLNYEINDSEKKLNIQHHAKREINNSNLVDFNSNNNFLRTIQHDSEIKITLPVIRVYPTYRFRIIPNIRNDLANNFKLAGNRANAYLGAGSYDASNYTDWIINQWLKRQLAKNNSKKFNNHFDILNKAITETIENSKGFIFENETLDEKGMLTFDFGHFGGEVQLDKMSDGQRSYINLFADLVHKICELNPQLDENILKETPGIVFIDELDLHLHPKWQRHIVGALKKTFPKIQFFATTHSPQIIGECKAEEIIILDSNVKEGWYRPPASFGMSSSDILTQIMGTVDRNATIKNDILKLFEELNKHNLEKAECLLKALKPKIGSLTDYTALESRITRYKILNSSGVA
jgi:predicted ATP-binding protein involved in virulence